MQKIEFKDLPDTTTPINADNLNLLQENLINLVYPIGAIYISVNNTNPNTLFGGTWEAIQDKFLLSAGTNHTAGSTGGKETVKLSANIGAVNSSPSMIGYNAETHTSYQGANNANIIVQGNSTGTFSNWNHSVSVTETTSTSRNVNIMPPYITVYMWKRIS